MTPFEDAAGPLLSEMVRSSDHHKINDENARDVAMWAVAALMIRSTVDPAIQRLAPEMMRIFRAEGIEMIDASVAVFSMVHTGAFFSGDAIGSTYIFDTEEPENSAVALFFFQRIVVVAGVGKFSEYVRRAAHVFSSGTALAWPVVGKHQGWPTRGEVVDKHLLRALGIERHSRSMFVPATPVHRSDASQRTVIRVPESFLLNEITTDQQLLLSLRTFEDVIARGLEERHGL